MKTKKGFTLLELLIVIGILAILSTTVVLVINPAQLLKKARDSQRISDLNTVKTAIAYYVTETGTPSMGIVAQTYSDVISVNCTGHAAAATTTALTTGGAGWIPINFDGMTGGSPIGSLPSDPNPTVFGANPGRYYTYLVANVTNFTFLLTANMESTYYSNGQTGDVESKDGGLIAGLYEVGTGMDTLAATSATCYAGTGE